MAEGPTFNKVKAEAALVGTSLDGGTVKKVRDGVMIVTGKVQPDASANVSITPAAPPTNRDGGKNEIAGRQVVVSRAPIVNEDGERTPAGAFAGIEVKTTFPGKDRKGDPARQEVSIYRTDGGESIPVTINGSKATWKDREGVIHSDVLVGDAESRARAAAQAAIVGGLSNGPDGPGVAQAREVAATTQAEKQENARCNTTVSVSTSTAFIPPNREDLPNGGIATSVIRVAPTGCPVNTPEVTITSLPKAKSAVMPRSPTR